MRKSTTLAGLALLLSATLATAQPSAVDDSVYRGLGGQDGIRKIVATFIPLVLADPAIGATFDDFDMEQLARRLGEQFCEVSGGPCTYTGKYRDKTMDGAGTVRDMTTVHQDLKITNAQFNALAEDLQTALERNDVPNGVANKLLARLAPMQRMIVTR